MIAALPLKKKIEASMGLKFVFALTAVISGFMVLGTLFFANMLIERQYQAIETRGRELGLFLGKAGTDALLMKEILILDGLVAEAGKSPDILYAYIADDGNRVLNTAAVSFNRSDTAMAALLNVINQEDVAVVAGTAKDKLDIIETKSDIVIDNRKIGLVTIGFSKAGARREAWKQALLLVGGSVVMVVILSGVIHLMVRWMIIAPTNEAVHIVLNIAGGDLTQSVRVKTVDELGMLGRGLNRMIIGLKGMVGNVSTAALNAESVWNEVREISSKISSGSRVQSESVDEAASSVNEMHFSLKEIGGNMEDLTVTSERTSSSVIQMAASVSEVAKTMSELAASIEETSSAISQMSAAIRQIADNVEVLSAAAEQTSSSSIEISASVKEVEATAGQSASVAEAVAADARMIGMGSIEKTIEGMGRIDMNARRTAEVVNRLGERAESIGGILTVIEDITDQTGLLALNAAILAAQAGEHGKGFAVVASEIRELANRTAASTKEIGTLITSVQTESREAVEAMKEGVSIVAEGVGLAGDARTALKKILERAETSRDMSKSINKAAIEQARGIKQVSEAMTQINDLAHKIARATSEQKTGSEQIIRAAEKMRDLTRFVKTSTEEQERASRDITHAVENISTKIGMVNRASEEVQAGSDHIVKAIDRIKQIAKDNADLGAGLTISMEVMTTQSGTLKKEIDKFRTKAAPAPTGQVREA